GEISQTRPRKGGRIPSPGLTPSGNKSRSPQPFLPGAVSILETLSQACFFPLSFGRTCNPSLDPWSRGSAPSHRLYVSSGLPLILRETRKQPHLRCERRVGI